MSDDGLGASLTPAGARFAVWSGAAERLWVSLFDASDRETGRIELARGEDGLFSAVISGVEAGERYGFRADGPYDPAKGLWFDPDKLLVDPYAVAIDRPYRHDPRLAARRGEGTDTAPLMPKALVTAPFEPSLLRPAMFRPGGLIYELPVRAFTMRHPDVPAADRGTLRALAHQAVIGHLSRLGVDAVELMPVMAWIDERHLPPLGLSNAWGYNPVTFMALDPRLAPGGLTDLRGAVAALHAGGIGVILDIVANHTGESDAEGPTLSLRGLDANAYFRHRDGRLVNDTGCGNTLRCDHPRTRDLILDSLRHLVRHAGVDGFRFDLAPVLGRDDHGFSPETGLLRAIAADPEIGSRILIAEPWDIGDGGYRLGGFLAPFLEWNDRARDDLRRFWRGDSGMLGAAATRLAGSSDIFPGAATRGLTFVAAHDGLTLSDLVAYERKHNEANGEGNRDGHNDNRSWNNGVEGATADAAILAARGRDVRALLALLFASRGAVMLTAGDEFGRTQGGNNNAYCQDNALTWLDWDGRDRELEAHVAALSALRRAHPALSDPAFLRGEGDPPDVEWLGSDGAPLTPERWDDPAARRLAMVLISGEGRLAVLVNADRRAVPFRLPARDGWMWEAAGPERPAWADGGSPLVPGRSVVFALERPEGASEPLDRA